MLAACGGAHSSHCFPLKCSLKRNIFTGDGPKKKKKHFSFHNQKRCFSQDNILEMEVSFLHFHLRISAFPHLRVLEVSSVQLCILGFDTLRFSFKLSGRWLLVKTTVLPGSTVVRHCGSGKLPAVFLFHKNSSSLTFPTRQGFQQKVGSK